VHQHAATIVDHGLGMQDINPTMIAECFLYGLFLCYNFHVATKLDWLSHASNYWICDAIIKGDRARDISNTVHGEIIWECDASLIDWVLGKDMKYIKPPILVVKDDDVYKEGPYRWISITTRNMEISGFKTIPATTSSLFLAFERFNHSSILSNGLFENSSNLGVLVLCSCAFNFAWPPFRKCQSLRFLGLDHCTTSKIGEEESHNHTEWACLYNLLVLDLRYTDWDEILSEEKMSLMTNITELNIEGFRCWQYTAQLQGRLPDLHRLRITRPTCPWVTSNDVDDSFIDKTCMEILDLSGNSDMKNLPASLSKASSLQMLVLDGCDGLENVGVPSRLPASLRCFSFDGYGPASHRTLTIELPPKHFRPYTAEDEKDIMTSKISLEGCTELDNLFVRGLNNLVELDLSGTAIKILDFETMVVQVPGLKRLFLIGCKHLRAIISLHETSLELICIDTRDGIMRPRPSIDTKKLFRLKLHVVVVDARIAYSFNQLSLRSHLVRVPAENIYFKIHITSSPRVYDEVVQFEETNNEKFDHCDQGSLQQLIPAGKYNDVLSMVEDPPMQAFPRPPATELDRIWRLLKGAGTWKANWGAN
jgi:Leucine-rich repeat (LRR) protein